MLLVLIAQSVCLRAGVTVFCPWCVKTVGKNVFASSDFCEQCSNKLQMCCSFALLPAWLIALHRPITGLFCELEHGLNNAVKCCSICMPCLVNADNALGGCKCTLRAVVHFTVKCIHCQMHTHFVIVASVPIHL